MPVPQVEVTTPDRLAGDLMSSDFFDRWHLLLKALNMPLDMKDRFIMVTSLSFVAAQAAAFAKTTERLLIGIGKQDIDKLAIDHHLDEEAKEGFKLAMKRGEEGLALVQRAQQGFKSREELDEAIGAYLHEANKDVDKAVDLDIAKNDPRRN